MMTCQHCGKRFAKRRGTRFFCSRECSASSRRKPGTYERQLANSRRWKKRNRAHHIAQSISYYKTRRKADPAWWEKRKAANRVKIKKSRLELLMAYGGLSCSCRHSNGPCGPKPLEHLALDHMNKRVRKKYPQTGWAICSPLRKAGWPSGFRVLCHNCNMALGFYGKCPLAKPSMEAIGG